MSYIILQIYRGLSLSVRLYSTDWNDDRDVLTFDTQCQYILLCFQSNQASLDSHPHIVDIVPFLFLVVS